MVNSGLALSEWLLFEQVSTLHRWQWVPMKVSAVSAVRDTVTGSPLPHWPHGGQHDMNIDNISRSNLIQKVKTSAGLLPAHNTQNKQGH